MKDTRGFSLVELLIILAIVSIIAAILVPSMLTSKWAANEAGAIQGCRTLGSGETAYAANHSGKFATIDELVSGGFLEKQYSTGFNGYSYTPGPVPGSINVGTPPDGFGFNATPVGLGGRHSFGIATDQIVRYLGTHRGAQSPQGMQPGDPINTTATLSQ
jgi:prepilin-type N-terminal cleavage/methylation domain-containing protein